MASEEAIVALQFSSGPENPNSLTQQAIESLDKYFNKKTEVFSIPLSISGTAFQQKVLQEVACIPYGTTITYAALSKRLGNPLAIRAIAQANAKNNLPIFIPCHRVVGTNDKLTGYIGELKTKKFLLELENNHRLF